MLFFTADPHYQHYNIIEYCNRPFKTAEEMDEAIIKNFNYYVRDEDVTYWLGDMGLATPEYLQTILSRLHGTHILIIGNHDQHGINTYYKLGFSAVLESAEIRIGKNRVTMSHYPNRSLKEFFRICRLDIIKMFKKERSWKHMWAKVRKEWSQYRPFSRQWHLCGHVHEKWSIRGKNINVGVDVRDFKPVSIRDIANIIDKETQKRS